MNAKTATEINLERGAEAAAIRAELLTAMIVIRYAVQWLGDNLNELADNLGGWPDATDGAREEPPPDLAHLRALRTDLPLISAQEGSLADRLVELADYYGGWEEG